MIDYVMTGPATLELTVGGKITNRQRRGIAADHSVRTGRLLDAVQHWLLDFGPFKYRFFDEICFSDRLGQASGGMKVISHQLRRARFEQALLLEVVGLPAQPIKMAACQGGIGVTDGDVQAGLREHLGDATTHISGADHGDVLDLHCHV